MLKIIENAVILNIAGIWTITLQNEMEMAENGMVIVWFQMVTIYQTPFSNSSQTHCNEANKHKKIK